MKTLDIQQRRSPNFGERRGEARVDMVVVHYTAMTCAEDALERLCDPQFEVSAHYLIAQNGEVFQMVDESKRAWHAGAGQWGHITDVNSHSIGIELDNTGASPFCAPQMNALELLLAGILDRYDIPPERVIGHSDMAPSRKIDPGARFDWQRLARQGLSVWPKITPKLTPPSAPSQAQFTAVLGAFGYPASAEFTSLLSAFRDRFRPHHTGPLDEVDMALAQGLAPEITAK
jgi:N-acetylmuramoyl-L-alanine amidase